MTDPGPFREARRTVEALIGRPVWDPVEADVRESDLRRCQETVGSTRPLRRSNGVLLAPLLLIPPFAVGGTIGEDSRGAEADRTMDDHPPLK